MTKFGIAVVIQLLLLAPVAIAQRGQVDNSEPGRVAAAKVSELSAQEFLTQTAEANQFEIDASKMAVQQAKKKEVKELAEALVADHTAAAEKLEAAVRADGTLALRQPDKPDTKHAQILDSLKGAFGDAFDRAYLDAMFTGRRSSATRATQRAATTPSSKSSPRK